MPKAILIVIASLILVAGMIFYFRWSSAIRQPLAFSHGEHVRVNISCGTCHTEKVPDSPPPASICVSSHTGMNPPPETQWIRVYRTAPDIIFSHLQHHDV